MITNKDIRVENGYLIINGNKYPLDGQSPEAIMQIVEDNSDTTPTADSTAPVTSGGVKTYIDEFITADNGLTENTDAIAAGSRKSFLIDIEKEGYTPLGIIGVFGSGTGGLSLGDFYLSPNNTATVYLNNNTSASITPTRVEVRILYAKTRS